MKYEKNNKMLNQFLEKVNNCKNDVDLSYSSMNSKEYSLTFNDFYGFDEEWNELYRDYDNPQAVEELKEWLDENCLERKDKLYSRYYFNDFIVTTGYASYDI